MLEPSAQAYPAGHTVVEVAPVGQKNPFGHVVQADWPELGWYWPPTHAVHAPAPKYFFLLSGYV